MRITLVVILLLSIALLLLHSGLRHGDLLVLLLRLSTEETTAVANEGVCATMQPYVTMPWAVEMNV